MCRVLSEQGCSIAPSTYYEARNHSASRRAVRVEEPKIEVSRVHAENYSVYGARTVWLEMRREGIDVARYTVERLMAPSASKVPVEARRTDHHRRSTKSSRGRSGSAKVQPGCTKHVVGS
jgi:putative transposase